MADVEGIRSETKLLASRAVVAALHGVVVQPQVGIEDGNWATTSVKYACSRGQLLNAQA